MLIRSPLCHVRALIVATLLLPIAFLAAAARVPTPISVLGHNPGDDFYLADYDDAIRYFHALAASSNRIKMFSVGKTTMGETFEIAVISSPENLARLDEYKADARKLADSRSLTEDQARDLSRIIPVIVHIDGGLHSDEVAGGQHSIQLAYKLLSAQNDPQVDAILHNVILVLWPTINPDGQNLVAHWYRRNVGTPFEVAPMPWLFQEYVGHDNNRDGYMLNMIESQVITRVGLDYSPVIFYCQHQTAPFPARIWIPPFADPISNNISPFMRSWYNVIGTQMAAALQEQHLPGAISQDEFDNWYPGFVDYAGVFRNEISFFTETALYRYATPRFYTVNEFPKQYQDLKALTMYTDPWQGGWWHLSDAVKYMVAASMSVLDTSAKYREQLLFNRWQAAHDNIEHYKHGAPYAYVVPNPQADTPEAALLMRIMLENGVEVRRATTVFHANGIDYSAGSWIILMDQPFSAMAKELFEIQHYPQAILDGSAKPVTLPYDVTGWTLPLQMGVKVDAVTDPISDVDRASLDLLTAIDTPRSGIAGAGPVFVVSHKPDAAFEAVNAVLSDGGSAAFSTSEVQTSEGPETGAFVLTGIARDRLQPILAKYGLEASAAPRPSSPIPLKKARIALYRPWQPSIDEGWTRWILEQYGFAPISIYNDGLRAEELNKRFDVILLSDMSKKQLVDGFQVGLVPSQYASGIGPEGVAALQSFVRQGGTLIAFNQSAASVIDLFNLPVANAIAGLKSSDFFCSGALLRVNLQEPSVEAPLRPSLYGLSPSSVVMFELGPVFETKPGFQGAVLATYPAHADPLESGILLHPEKIEGKAAALEVSYGNGRIFLYGFKPQWRGQSHGAYKFFMNALYRYDQPPLPTPAAASPSTIQPVATPSAKDEAKSIPASAGQEDDEDLP
jgi:hypothetical protein